MELGGFLRRLETMAVETALPKLAPEDREKGSTNAAFLISIADATGPADTLVQAISILH